MRITALIAGSIFGLMAALAQAFFRIIPPPAYGICIACHMRDMVNWIAAHIYPIYGLTGGGALKIPGGPVSYKFPLLTIVGILIGAFIASRIHKEFSWKTMRVSWQRPVPEFFWGLFVMISALIFGGCPIRTALKTAYLDITALIGLVMIFIGVIIGCEVIKKKVRR
ncbi:YeeE/YedE family protein [candidate division WOR-3 bacterium]|nr:YeeE/YedE family protein [candidate division WOR-3 bacterium]